jgi:hypothetical protein
VLCTNLRKETVDTLTQNYLDDDSYRSSRVSNKTVVQKSVSGNPAETFRNVTIYKYSDGCYYTNQTEGAWFNVTDMCTGTSRTPTSKRYWLNSVYERDGSPSSPPTWRQTVARNYFTGPSYARMSRELNITTRENFTDTGNAEYPFVQTSIHDNFLWQNSSKDNASCSIYNSLFLGNEKNIQSGTLGKYP